jgi:hypothetical protein
MQYHPSTRNATTCDVQQSSTRCVLSSSLLLIFLLHCLGTAERMKCASVWKGVERGPGRTQRPDDVVS